MVSFITLMVFLPALQNEFINWDDDYYVYANQYIQSPLRNVTKWAFFHFYIDNWHPLTWISHAIDYTVWGLNPLGHHLTNNLLHALNTFLVVFLSVGLIGYDRRRETTEGLSGPFFDEKEILIAGAATGLLFGIHPLHVESVAWISERKDVLSALFFCLSILSYIRYASCMENRGRAVTEFFNRYYFLTFLFFICALLSKPMVVTLPAVLLILDWYPFQRIHSLRTFGTALKEKIPFLVLSSAVSLVTILAQSGAIKPLEAASFPTRMIMSSKAIVSYLGKMVLPLGLVPFYPYPAHVSLLSLKYLLPVLAVIVITLTCIILLVRSRKVWLAVWGYFIVTLLPVLGLIQVGNQSMADRYTYLPGLGPFLVLGLAAALGYRKLDLLKQWGLRKEFIGGVLSILLVVSLSFLTAMQITVWKNSLSFWDYVIDNTAEQLPFAYCNRGIAYELAGKYDLAIKDLDAALVLQPKYPIALHSRGRVYFAKGMHARAIEDFTKAITLKPDYFEAFNSRGVTYGQYGLLAKATQDFDRAIALKPDYYEALSNRGFSLMLQGQYDKAVESYNSAIMLDGNRAAAYIRRAQVMLKMGKDRDAASDLRKGCELGSETACVELEKLVKH